LIETEVLVQVPTSGAGRLRLVEYTDPYSIWCWGCEPAIRRVEQVYPDAVEIEIRMGGLFEDFGPMREQFARMSGGRWQESVLAFMNAVAEHHQMPMDPAAMMDTIEDFTSTWPACVAVKAAELQGSPVGRKYLRRLREASLIEGRAIHRPDVQQKLAAEVGLHVGRFARALEGGAARAAFEGDLQECKAHKVTGFPTFEAGRGEVSLRIEGWQPWESIDETLHKLDPQLEGREIAATKGNALVLLHHYGRCATREVSAVFGVTDDESSILLEDLEADGKVYRREVGKGVMWELPAGKWSSG
jgi:predicted DsbA family dithiol-disulfide isomerase